MSEEFESKFVGDKISRVKFTDASIEATTFLSGTYDAHSNSVDFWSINSQEDEDGEAMSVIDNLSKIPHRGDVTGLDYNKGLAAASSSKGHVSLYKMDKLAADSRLNSLHCWESLHIFKSGNASPCTDLAIEDNIATCGEDGTIHILDTTKPAPIRSLVDCDSTSLTSILWVTQQCVAVVNTCGQLKVFDIRQNEARPIQTFVLSGEINALNCLEKHPSQHHLVATGSYNGMLGIYDLRQDKVPVTVLEGHQGSSITDIKFHPRSPDSLFSSAADGSVWQWNGGRRSMRPGGDIDGPSAWFLADAAKHRIEVIELSSATPQASIMSNFEVNSLDVSNNTLVCGTDNGAICIFNNLIV
ncbi:nucleoporin Nup43-like [Watersipora subatra]|uniref:nucleoporin Nup43-like n=1 Tax=Watersipora subatra TaxID=2589382 RepID=UPI00355B2CE0